MNEQPVNEPISDRERMIRLALVIKERGPIDFLSIRRAMPTEYGFYEGDDGEELRRNEDAVRRKFERDKKILQDYGFFLATDADSRYFLDENASYAVPVDLDKEEESLLRMLCAALLDDEFYPFKSELRMIMSKIGDELDLPDMLASSGEDPAQERPSATLKKARKALRARKRLSFDYKDSHGASSRRDVEPVGCFLFNKHLYLVAFDPEAGAERSFRFDRMSHAKVNAKQPSKPDFDERPFVASDYFGLPFQFGDDDFAACIRFDPEREWQTDRLCMQKGTLEPTDAGTLWHVDAADAHMLARWCVEHGPGIEPVAPQEAVTAYREGLARFLKNNPRGLSPVGCEGEEVCDG